MKKILILGDMHGIKPNIHYKGYDSVICSGDFAETGDLRPYFFKAVSLRQQNKKTQWYEFLGKKKSKDFVMSAVKAGERLLYYLKTLGVPVFYVPGNNEFSGDVSSNWSFLRKDNFKLAKTGMKGIYNCDLCIRKFGEYTIIGYGQSFGPEDPRFIDTFDGYSKKRQKEIARFNVNTRKKLDRLFQRALRMKRKIIFISHNVPFNTRLDTILHKDSPRYGMHYGSTLAKEMIEKYQPLICIGGHMHEHFNKDMLGKTVCINAGYGADANILLKLSKNKIKSIEFFGGAKG